MFSIQSLVVDQILPQPMSFFFKENDRVAVIGPSGAGKTSLLKGFAMMVGRAKKMRWESLDLINMHPLERSKWLSWTPERLEWAFDMSALDVTLLGSQNWGQESLQERTKAADALKSLDIHPEQRVRYMSTGELRRLTVAHTLCTQSKVLVIDEPTANLDPRHAYQALSELCNKESLIVFATHDLLLALEFATVLIVVNKGQIVCCGEPQKVWSRSVLKDVFQVDIFQSTHFGEKLPFLKPWINPEEQ